MPQQFSGETVQTVFHADLSDGFPGEDYWLVVGNERIPMQVHTNETRAQAFAAAPHLAGKKGNVNITHFTANAVSMPMDRVIRVHLKHSLRGFPNAKGEAGVSHSAIYHAPVGKRKHMLANGGPMHFGPINYKTTAQNLLFHHQDVITNDGNLNDAV